MGCHDGKTTHSRRTVDVTGLAAGQSRRFSAAVAGSGVARLCSPEMTAAQSPQEIGPSDGPGGDPAPTTSLGHRIAAGDPIRARRWCGRGGGAATLGPSPLRCLDQRPIRGSRGQPVEPGQLCPSPERHPPFVYTAVQFASWRAYDRFD